MCSILRGLKLEKSCKKKRPFFEQKHLQRSFSSKKSSYFFFWQQTPNTFPTMKSPQPPNRKPVISLTDNINNNNYVNNNKDSKTKLFSRSHTLLVHYIHMIHWLNDESNFKLITGGVDYGAKIISDQKLGYKSLANDVNRAFNLNWTTKQIKQTFETWMAKKKLHWGFEAM